MMTDGFAMTKAKRFLPWARGQSSTVTHRVRDVTVYWWGAVGASRTKPRLVIETYCGAPSSAVGRALLVSSPDPLHPVCTKCAVKAARSGVPLDQLTEGYKPCTG